ncbi:MULTISPECIES: phage tail assembly protein [Comamonas]|uniref:phage tail assembly protein n=1 Tax=Comamonas TaxID=283 RepID=UPI00257E2BC9|nr:MULTISPECIES: phage tail assembly protein [Comamonas]
MNTPETQTTSTATLVDNASSNTSTIKLDTPIIRPSGQTITEVAVRKPLAGALKTVALADLLSCKYEAVATVLPRVTTPMLHKQDVEAMDPADFFKLGSEVAGFLLSKELKASLPA